MALVDLSDGTVVAEYEYSPFGKTLRATGPAVADNPFKFSTKYEDEGSGLYYYGLRSYNPDTGRWLSRDPIAELGGISLQTILRNDPLGYTDTLGLADRLGYTLLSRYFTAALRNASFTLWALPLQRFLDSRADRWSANVYRDDGTLLRDARTQRSVFYARYEFGVRPQIVHGTSVGAIG